MFSHDMSSVDHLTYMDFIEFDVFSYVVWLVGLHFFLVIIGWFFIFIFWLSCHQRFMKFVVYLSVCLSEVSSVCG